MVDYTNELRNLRQMRDDHLLRYGTNYTRSPSEQEIESVRGIRKKIEDIWQIAVQTQCDDSEDELVDTTDILDKLAIRRNHNV